MHSLACAAVACFAATCLIVTHAAATPLPPQSTNLVQNGGFESGNFNDWSGNPPDSLVMNQSYDGYSPEAGAYYALLGPRGQDGTLFQSITDARGEALTLSFWLASDGDIRNDFTASFDGHALLALTNITEQGWTLYTETVTATGNDTLQFSFRDDPGYLALDNVSLTPSPVPEPATAALLLTGLAGLGVVRNARRPAAGAI